MQVVEIDSFKQRAADGHHIEKNIQNPHTFTHFVPNINVSTFYCISCYQKCLKANKILTHKYIYVIVFIQFLLTT